MTDITIPPEAVEAGARAAHDLWRMQASAGDDIAEYEQWDDLSRFYKDELRDQARAAIRAALKAWPNQHVVEDDVVYILNALTLPLTEKPNAEA